MLCVWLPRRSDHSKETAKEREGFRKASTSLSASLEDESDEFPTKQDIKIKGRSELHPSIM